jgi:hypothetical protein
MAKIGQDAGTGSFCITSRGRWDAGKVGDRGRTIVRRGSITMVATADPVDMNPHLALGRRA